MTSNDLYEMAAIIQEDSGLPMIVYVFRNHLQHIPHIKIQRDYASTVSGDFFSITIEDKPEVMGDTGEFKKPDIVLAKRWVKINMKLLTDYWTGRERSTKKVLNELIKVVKE